jgi:hypothetical protein
LETEIAAEAWLVMEFREFPKIPRFSRQCCVTEKIDGTNGCVHIAEDGEMLVGSRTRWITPEQDNYGFAAWAHEHRDELLQLGPGTHFGEWWGQGIQRNYGMKEKRWSLFNVSRWCLHDAEPQPIPTQDPRVVKLQQRLPACVGLVPVLWTGLFDALDVEAVLARLKEEGSRACPGFMKPEGIVIFHFAANAYFKKTVEKDSEPKQLQRNA